MGTCRRGCATVGVALSKYSVVRYLVPNDSELFADEITTERF
jgi:hypothetical protein